MYSSVWNQAGILRDSGFSDTQLDALQAVFAQCLSELTHRGKLELLGSRPIGASDATLTVANYPYPPDEIDDASPRNGCALHVIAGKTCIDGAAEFNGPVSGLSGNGSSVCWGKVLYNGVASDTTVGHVLGTVDTWESTVSVTPVTDKTGATPTGDPTRTVYLWRDHITDPNFRLDEVIPFVKDENDVAVSYHGRDAKIGTHQERVDIANPAGTPNYTAANGYRGWRVADGTNGTQDRGGKVSYGWKAGGGFATVGGNIAESATISAHAGSGTDAAISASGSITNAAIASAATADDASTGINVGNSFVIDNPVAGNTATDPNFAISLTDPEHSHDLAPVGGGSQTVSVTGTVDDNNIRLALGDHSASNVLAAGETVVVLQRVN